MRYENSKDDRKSIIFRIQNPLDGLNYKRVVGERALVGPLKNGVAFILYRLRWISSPYKLFTFEFDKKNHSWLVVDGVVGL